MALPARTHAADAAFHRYFPPAGPTATNLQQRVCCCAAMLGQTDRRTNVGQTPDLHHDLHWLDGCSPWCHLHKLCMTVYRCLHSLAPKYLAQLCVPVADVAGRRQLRSASRGLLNFPRYNMSNYGRRAFRFAGPYVWNSLPEHIRQSTSIAVFKRSLKTFLLQQISHLAH